MPQAAAYEVATFYAHFDVVKEGETPPPPTTIRVCDSITCAIKGAEALVRGAQVRRRSGARCGCCMRRAWAAATPLRSARSDIFTSITPRPKAVEAVVKSGKRETTIPRYETLAEYRAKGGYSVLESCRAGKLSVRHHHQGDDRRRLARAGRRRLSRRAQMADRALLSRPAADDHQRRRGRARHVQGPLSISNAIRIRCSRAR